MKLHVRLFARAKDLVGQEVVDLELPEGAVVADLRNQLGLLYPVLKGLLKRSALAVNNEFAADAATIPGSAEIAVLPPVSGGCDARH